jgi:hypothetical protein
MTNKIVSTDKLQMYWHKWTLHGTSNTSCWMTMTVTVFHLPPETH